MTTNAESIFFKEFFIHSKNGTIAPNYCVHVKLRVYFPYIFHTLAYNTPFSVVRRNQVSLAPVRQKGSGLLK